MFRERLCFVIEGLFLYENCKLQEKNFMKGKKEICICYVIVYIKKNKIKLKNKINKILKLIKMKRKFNMFTLQYKIN